MEKWTIMLVAVVVLAAVAAIAACGVRKSQKRKRLAHEKFVSEQLLMLRKMSAVSIKSYYGELRRQACKGALQNRDMLRLTEQVMRERGYRLDNIRITKT